MSLEDLRSGATGALVATIITCPTKPNQSTKVFGDPFTPSDLEYMRMRDSKIGFIIDTRVDDAFRNGLVFKDKKDIKRASKVVPYVKKFWKFAMQHGWSVVMHKEGMTPDLAAALPPDAMSIGIQGFHPWTANDGGIARIVVDPISGYPKTYYYRGPRGTISTDLPIDATRCDLYTYGDETTSWQGYSAAGKAYDPALGLRLWLAAALRRQRDFPGARYIIKGIDPGKAGQPVDAAVVTELKKSFPNIDVAAFNGVDVDVAVMESTADTGEGQLVVDTAKEDAATGAAIAKTDMTGSQAGAKLSTDADTSTYAMTAKDIQASAFPNIEPTFEKLGMPIEGFKTASELPSEQKQTAMVELMDLYGRCMPELKQIVADRLTSFMSSEYGQDIEISVVIPQIDPATGMPVEAPTAPDGKKPGIMDKIKGAFKRPKKEKVEAE